MKVLFVLSRLPYPLEKGDKLRAFHQMKELAKTNDIYLFCLNNQTIHPEAINILSEFIKDIHIASYNKFDNVIGTAKSFFDCTPLQVGYFSHKKNIKALKDYCKQINPDVLFFQFVRMAKYAKDIDTPKVLDFQDALSANMKRRASKSGFINKFIFKREANLLIKYEAKMFNIFDKLTIIVDADKKEIKHPRQDEIIILPNGVDNSYFDYHISYKKEFDIIFSGSMSYHPNIIAANYLAKEIMPLVWKKTPNTKLVIAGANPTMLVKGLASKKITVTGWVDDMKEYYAKSKIFIAPMLTGTGLQNKLLEAMAMGLPCITSSLANNSLGAYDGKNILIANTPEENAEKIISLLNYEDVAKTIAEQGKIFVQENYRWESYGEVLNSILKSIK